MRRLMILAVVFCLPVVSAFGDDKPPAESGFKAIFNGEDLAGWDGDPRLWTVKDGVIHGETTKENPTKGNTFLIWQDGKLGDFELRLSFRCNATNNSGIQYRSQRVEKSSNAWVVKGYQHEIRNQEKLPSVSGFIYDEKGKRGRMCLVGEKATWSEAGKKTVAKEKLIDAAGYEELFKLDGWNDVIIKAEGKHLQHFMNGKLIMDCTDHDPRGYAEGVLALQLHGGIPMWVEFKDIRLKQE